MEKGAKGALLARPRLSELLVRVRVRVRVRAGSGLG